MSRQEALRNDLKALELLRDRLNARWKEVRQAADESPRQNATATRELARVDQAEYADPRKVFRN